MKKILVPTDFSPNSMRAIDYAVKMAKENDATVYLAHTIDVPDMNQEFMPPPDGSYNMKEKDEALKKLENLRRSIEDTEQLLVNTHLYHGNVTDNILKAAEEHDADIIIMGTLGITGLADKIFGTHTASVISHSDTPVLAIPLEYEWNRPSRLLLAINHFDEGTDILFPVFDIAAIFDAEVRVAVFTDEDTAGSADYMEHARNIVEAGKQLKEVYKGISVIPQHISGHQFMETMNEYIDSNQVDLLAMTTHKRSLVSSIFKRSVTRKMSYQSKVPVLAIPVPNP